MARPDTREKILDHAERLFAEQGYDRASLRGITETAGVNLAAVHYHFGSKEELLGAVLQRRIGPINRERLCLLDAAVAAAPEGIPTLREVLDSFLRPAVDQLHRMDAHVLMGLARILHERGDIARRHFEVLFTDVVQRYRILERICPELSPEEIQARFHFMIGALLHSTVQQGSTAIAPPRFDPEQQLGQLLAFVEAGFSAPSTIEENTP
jgi:AcrR family transcriptional regulator